MRYESGDLGKIKSLIEKVKIYLSQKEEYIKRHVHISWRSEDCDLDLYKVVDYFSKYYYIKFSTTQIIENILNGVSPFEKDFLNLCTAYYRFIRRPTATIQNKKFGFGNKIVYQKISVFKDMNSFKNNFTLPNFSLSHCKVLVKPNFVSNESYPEISDFKFLKFLIGIIKNNGANKIIIADGPSMFFSSDIFKRKEINELKNEYNIEIRNVLDESDLTLVPIQSTKGPLNDIFLPSFLFDIDLLINLSLFKEHREVGFSGALKNMMGLIPRFERLRFHNFIKEDFIRAIIQLNHIVKSDLVIMDARKVLKYGQQRIFGGEPSNGFGIVIGNNVFEIDRFALSCGEKYGISVKYSEYWKKEINKYTEGATSPISLENIAPSFMI